MGIAKSLAIEAEERGYFEFDTFVCDECVGDEFLKSVVRAAVAQPECSYCRRKSQSPIAAPFSVLIKPIADTVHYYFCEPTQAGVPWKGGFLIDSIETAEVLSDLGLECHDDLFNDLCEAFQETDWVPSADSHWSSSHEHEILGDSWSSFVETITHRTRFFFGNAKLSPDAGPQEYAPRSMLPRLGQLVKSIGLRQVLKAGHVFYRARQRQLEEEWAADSRSMSAPPSHLARAGRMNPAGISYLYLAHDRATAVAEVQPSLSETMFVAKFELTRDVSVLDFSAPPGCPSIFDGDRRRIREALLFLERFVDEICRPVVKDGREHIDYVPSQVVCEYFALVFEADAAGSRVDGIVYPSAVRPGWRNLVLFPTERGPQNSFESIRFLCVED